jgi:hypothetical protein
MKTLRRQYTVDIASAPEHTRLGRNMAKKKRVSMAAALGEAVNDVANAVSVSATGSEIGTLELAAEDELKPTRIKRARTAKPVAKKKAVAKKPKGPIKKKRVAKHR